MSSVVGLLGLGLRAGHVVIGVEAVRRALQAGECRCVVLARDASQRALEKTARLATAKGIPRITGPQADELGAKLGKPPIMVVAVRDPALADGIIRIASEQGSMEG